MGTRSPSRVLNSSAIAQFRGFMRPLRAGNRGIRFGLPAASPARNHAMTTPRASAPPPPSSSSGHRDRRHGFDMAAPLIGSTTVMGQLRATIERVACTDFTVLLEGESGVGKELVARQIHEL